MTHTIPELPNNLCLLVEVGSTAHGTGLEGMEDHDEIGIVVETPEQVFSPLVAPMHSVMHRTQPEGVQSGPGDTDRTLHSLRRFLYLAAAGNPSILMCFYAPVIESNSTGENLRLLAPAFVGRHVIPKYRGYMKSQAERLLGTKSSSGHGVRGGGGRPELIEQFGFDTKYAMHCARLGFQCEELITHRRLKLPIEGWQGDWLRALRKGEVPFEEWWHVVLDLDSRLEEMQKMILVPEGPDIERISEWSFMAHVDWTWGC